jgi:GTP-binding protein
MSSFVDEVSIQVAAGRGGRGASSFRREKFVPNGGPDGGDGGRGGDVVIHATREVTTLSDFRHNRRFRAVNGGDGSGNKRSGKRGDDCVIRVPPGTMVRNAEGEVLADLDHDEMKFIVAKGGRGGRGNARFASATHQAPRHAELGDPGDEMQLDLELKLIADIGLVGMPNAGKSTLLSAWTRAHPKIAPYPFTTLSPNLGVADIDDVRSVVVADVPGLIEGAHDGAGLGLEFLRHVERTRVLVHVVDASVGVEEARHALVTIHHELEAFDPALAERQTLIAFNKTDVPEGAECAEQLMREFSPSIAIAAITGDHCAAALKEAAEMVAEARAAAAAEAPAAEGDGHRVYRFDSSRKPAMVIPDDDGVLRVHSADLERIVSRTDTNNEESVARLWRRFRRENVDHALRAAGCRDGDTVRVGATEFEFMDEVLRDG